MTLISKRPFAFEGGKGEEVSGIMYAGFDETNTVISFSSKDENKEIFSAMKFDEKHYCIVNIEARIWDGKVKYREVN